MRLAMTTIIKSNICRHRRVSIRATMVANNTIDLLQLIAPIATTRYRLTFYTTHRCASLTTVTMSPLIAHRNKPIPIARDAFNDARMHLAVSSLEACPSPAC